MGGQIQSKRRVAEREVNAMLDLVKQETERIDSRFLEPACDDGNYLSQYGLTTDEIAFIESMIRPMDLGESDDE